MRVNTRQIVVGFVALTVGLLFYLLERPPWQMPYDISDSTQLPEALHGVGNSIPSFIHVFSFSLIMGGLLAPKRRTYQVVCSGWAVTNLFFEFGQASAVYRYFEPYVSAAAKHYWIGEAITGFFQDGIFDPWDLMAIIAGALIAYAVLVRIENRERQNDFDRILAR